MSVLMYTSSPGATSRPRDIRERKKERERDEAEDEIQWKKSDERIFESYYFSKRWILKDVKLYAE